MGHEQTLTQDDVKMVRGQLGNLVAYLEAHSGGSRERSLAITKLEEGKMWLGKELGNLGGEDLNAKRDSKDQGLIADLEVLGGMGNETWV